MLCVEPPFAGSALDGVISVAPERWLDVWKRQEHRTRGIAGFSQPGYAADRSRALVYGVYHCGVLCGYGWLSLLERREGTWHVVADSMLWIS